MIVLGHPRMRQGLAVAAIGVSVCIAVLVGWWRSQGGVDTKVPWSISAPVTTMTTQPSAASQETSSAATRPSDAYLWQRRGDAAAVAAFIAQLGGGRLRVLAAEQSDHPYRRGRDVVVSALARSSVDVIVVVRVSEATPAAAALALQSIDDFAGARVVGVEIDFDCGTQQLGPYAAFLRALGARLSATHPNVSLGITALPAWLSSTALDEVVAAVDDLTLQVHSIRAPALLETRAAHDAVVVAQSRFPHVSIALPTYATTLASGERLYAHVDDVLAVARLAHHIVWFRLPAAGDDSAWSFSTLRAVDARPGSLTHAVHVEIGELIDGRRELRVRNTGALDVEGACVVVEGAATFDAIAPFVRRHDGALCPDHARFYGPRASLLVGWARPHSQIPDTLRAHFTR